MQRKSWNDINNEDSSDSESSEEISQNIKLYKKVSAPTIGSGSRLREACDELSIDRIQKHEQKDVWLYIPNAFHSRTDDVHEILQDNVDLKQVYMIQNVGWNVLAQTQYGRKLISEGYSKDGIFIKFIYSSRNERKDQRYNYNEQKMSKLTKKKTYVEKSSKMMYQEGQNYENIYQKESTKIYNQEVNLAKNQKNQKKKPKWVQKSSNSNQNREEMKSPGNIQPRENKQQEFVSPKKNIKEQEIKSPRYKPKYIQNKQNKYSIKQPTSPKYKPKYQESNKKQTEKDQVKEQITLKQEITSQIKEQMIEQTKKSPQKDKSQIESQKNKEQNKSQVQKSPTIINQTQGHVESPQKQQEDEDDDDSNQQEDKKDKKKKKKKNKKNKNAKKQVVLDNNPFSYLMK